MTMFFHSLLFGAYIYVYKFCFHRISPKDGAKIMFFYLLLHMYFLLMNSCHYYPFFSRLSLVGTLICWPVFFGFCCNTSCIWLTQSELALVEEKTTQDPTPDIFTKVTINLTSRKHTHHQMFEQLQEGHVASLRATKPEKIGTRDREGKLIILPNILRGHELGWQVVSQSQL
ncbi:hypothetical protein ACJX0J_033178 [Zea mays]